MPRRHGRRSDADLVRQQQPHVDVGIGGQKLGDDRQNMQAAEEYRGCQDQFAARLLELADRDRSVSSTSSRMRFADAMYADPTSVRPTLAGRPRQQLGPEVGFEFAHFPADGRQRHAHWRLAAEKLPVSATRTRIDIASRRSMTISLSRIRFLILANYRCS